MSAPAKRSSADIYTAGIELLEAVATAQSKDAAIEAARAHASDLGADELRRVLAMVAVESLTAMRKQRGRRYLTDWLERLRFSVIVSGVEDVTNP